MEDIICPECEKNSFEFNNMNARNLSIQNELNRLNGLYDLKCDQLRESLITNARLRLLLHEKGASHDY